MLVLGESVTVEATCATVIAAVPLTGPEVAVTVAVPLATAVRSPADETVAIVVSDDAQVTVASDITAPPASFTVAVRVAVSPTNASAFVFGDTVTLAATWPKDTEAVLLAEPEVAVIEADPAATEVTSPADETVTVEGADELHVTVAPVITLPPASFTVAANVAVSPTEEKASDAGEISTVAAT